MFWPTVLWLKSASDWKTMQVGRRLAGTWLTRSSRRKMSPAVGFSRPPSMRSSVVLPLPEGPTMVKNSPSRMSRVTSFTATSRPNALVRLTMRRMGAASTMALVSILSPQRHRRPAGAGRARGRGGGARPPPPAPAVTRRLYAFSRRAAV